MNRVPKSLVLVGSALVLLFSLRGVFSTQPASPNEMDSGTSSQNRIKNGRELLSVFITSDGCGPSHDPRLPSAISDINSALEQRIPLNKSFTRIGVNLHHEIQSGLMFLNRFGRFDEVVVGGSWLNSASVTWIIRNKGNLNTPQLLLVERDITPRQYTLDVGADSVVLSAVGVDAITALADSLRREEAP